MPLTTKKTVSDFPPIEAGTHHAVCYGVVDLGTQDIEWKGQKKKSPQLAILWEIPDLTYEAEVNGVKQTFCKTISKTYTNSLGEKAKLRADLTSWRGVPFTEKDLEGFDVFNVLGVNCIITIVHTKKNTATYANISTISKLMKNMAKVNPSRELVKYSIEDNGFTIPPTVPKWLIEKIHKSAEFCSSQVPEDDATGVKDDLPDWETPEEPKDDIPF